MIARWWFAVRLRWSLFWCLYWIGRASRQSRRASFAHAFRKFPFHFAVHDGLARRRHFTPDQP